MVPFFKRKEVGFKREEKAVLRKIVLAPVDMRISVDDDLVRFVKEKLLSIKEPTGHGRYLKISLLGHEIPFYVLSSEPSLGIIGEETEVELLPEFPRLKGDVYVLEVKTLKPSEKIIIYKGDSILHSEVEENQLKLYILRYKGKASISDIKEG